MEEIVGFPISVLTSVSTRGFKLLTTGLHQVQGKGADVFVHEIFPSAEEFAHYNHMPLESACGAMEEHVEADVEIKGPAKSLDQGDGASWYGPIKVPFNPVFQLLIASLENFCLPRQSHYYQNTKPTRL